MSTRNIPRRFDIALLTSSLERDSAELIGVYSKLNRESVIDYRCKCGITNRKKFSRIVNSYALCQKCGKKHKVDAQIKTTLEKYGTTNAMKNSEVRGRAKATMKTRTEEERNAINTKRKITNLKKYGGAAPACSTEVREKMCQTNLERYGTTVPLRNEEVKRKSISTNQTLYGVNAASMTNVVKEKAKNTCLERYGVISTALVPEIKQKQISTLIQNYGVINPFESNAIKDKIKETLLEKYGVEHPNQNSEIFEKAQKKSWKQFIMPSGAIRKVQGYEPFALKELLTMYTEDQIKTDRKDVGRVPYEVNGKKRYHFPDIFIPHENKYIEVKSTWTYDCKTDNIHIKKAACEVRGYSYEVWIFDSKGNRIEPTPSP